MNKLYVYVKHISDNRLIDGLIDCDDVEITELCLEYKHSVYIEVWIEEDNVLSLLMTYWVDDAQWIYEE